MRVCLHLQPNTYSHTAVAADRPKTTHLVLRVEKVCVLPLRLALLLPPVVADVEVGGLVAEPVGGWGVWGGGRGLGM
jgi:hypothetical protein